MSTPDSLASLCVQLGQFIDARFSSDTANDTRVDAPVSGDGFFDQIS